jgi:7-keto-8-aminopelargonate synthetase-like enzyme
MGGFVAGRTSLIKALATRPRGYQHSTSLPAAACAAALAAVEIIVGEPDRHAVLVDRAAGVRGELLRQGWNIRTSASHIIPVWIKDAHRAEAIAAALRNAGYYLPCVVSPHAAAGRSMLRLRINYGHEPEMIEGLLSRFSRSA